jgi:dodecin
MLRKVMVKKTTETIYIPCLFFYSKATVLLLNKKIMSIVKVIEVIVGSEKSFDDAAQKAVDEAAKTGGKVKSIYIKEMTGKVENNKIVSYGVNAKISFYEEELVE